MDLSDIYSQQVKKAPVANLCVGGNMPIIEKDPSIRRLEEEVFAKMRSIMPQEPEVQQAPRQEVVPLSFEDALKELVKMQKQG